MKKPLINSPAILRMVFLLLLAVVFSPSVNAALGDVPEGGFRSPEGEARFSLEAGVKPLNNLVFELLNVESPGTDSHAFHNPREGWVYVRVEREGGNGPSAVQLDDDVAALKAVDNHIEAMRYLTEGAHTIRCHAPAKRLEVRAIGDLVYATYGLNPHIAEMGVYTWDFLREHCLDHYNGIIGMSSADTQEDEIREWTAEGKRWYTSEEVPYDVETADEAYERWSNALGMRHPLMSGIWADEFGVGEKYGKYTADMYPIWIEALRRLHANPALAGRTFVAYGPSRLLPADRFEQMYPFFHAIMDLGYRYAPEWYLPEGHSRPGRTIAETGDLWAEFSPGWEQATRASFEQASPGAASNRMVVVSLLSEPGWESGDLFPNYDFNVFLDCQLQFIATDPSFFGIRGLQGYLSSYCGEEQTRLFAQLIRHYAIEGKTTRLLDDPYVLLHLENADLSNGDSGWTLAPAEHDVPSIAIKTVPGFGVLQARYHGPEGTGDTAIWTRRSGASPNRISQSIRNLQAGKLYSLRMITGDYLELAAGQSTPRQHAVSIALEGVEEVADKGFQAVVQCAHWHSYGAFNAGNPYWINYHQRVFRARENTAGLVLTDWQSQQTAGGPAGEELLWTFFQVQPYFE
ncbi:MAG: hypothetical protein AMXMBFR84_33070 [Candidatus Hydrogenedentota bacterium]